MPLYRFGRVEGADIRGRLADEVFVCAFDRDLGPIGHRYLYAGRNLKENRMRLPEAQVELLALDGGLKADTLDFEFLFETFANAGHHIGDQGPGETVQRFCLSRFLLTIEGDAAALHPSANCLRKIPLQLASWPLYRHGATRGDVHLHLRGHFNGFSADS